MKVCYQFVSYFKFISRGNKNICFSLKADTWPFGVAAVSSNRKDVVPTGIMLPPEFLVLLIEAATFSFTSPIQSASRVFQCYPLERVKKCQRQHEG